MQKLQIEKIGKIPWLGTLLDDQVVKKAFDVIVQFWQTNLAGAGTGGVARRTGGDVGGIGGGVAIVAAVAIAAAGTGDRRCCWIDMEGLIN